MKRAMMMILGAMTIGMTTPALAEAGDLPKWEPTAQNFAHTLKSGMNLVELEGTSAIVFIEKQGTNLFAFATSAEQRQPLADGDYRMRRAGISQCTVKAGLIESCR